MRDFEAAIRNSICGGDLESLKTLLKEKNINSPLKSGWTPLHHACSGGRDIIVNYLLKHGATADCHYEFFTPLMAVCDSCSSNEEKLLLCARSLIEFKADFNAMDKHKTTPLMFACTKGYEKLVCFLLELNCDVNMVDNNGQSALHLACIYNRPNVVKMLLQHGAEKKVKDQRGRLPIALATEKGANDIILMLDDEPEPEIHGTDHVDYVRKKTSFEELLTELPSYKNSSGKDGFHKDVTLLLSGMKLEQRADLFSNNGVSLAQFLNIKNDELKKLGVAFSSHRNKIITGNKRFICHPWGTFALPDAKKDTVEIMDIVRSLANSIKQLHILWVTVLYSDERLILPSNKEDKKVDDLYQVVLRTCLQTSALIKELKLIQRQVEKLDKVDKVYTVDLISPMKHKTCISVGRVLFVTAFCAFVAWKSNFISMLRR